MNGLEGVGVLFVNNFAAPGLGGGETHLLNIVDASMGAGARVHVACVAGGELERVVRERGAVTVPLGFSRTGVLADAATLRRYITAQSIAIVHSSGVLANFVARRAARDPRVHVVTTVQVEAGASVLDGGSRAGAALRRRLEGATSARTDRFVAVSEAIARSLVAGGVAPERVVLARNGVDAARVRQLARGELPADIPAEGLLAGCVARLEPVKGVDVFLRAAAIVARERQDVRFAVVGDGSQRSALEALASELHLARRSAFTGAVAPAAPVLARLDVVAVPSRSEGLPMLVLEAMALGRPLVASRVGGIPEAVVDGETGVLVAPEDPEALAKAMLMLLGNPDRARSLGDAARTRVEAEFSLSAQVDRYLALFAELVA